MTTELKLFLIDTFSRDELNLLNVANATMPLEARTLAIKKWFLEPSRFKATKTYSDPMRVAHNIVIHGRGINF